MVIIVFLKNLEIVWYPEGDSNSHEVTLTTT